MLLADDGFIAAIRWLRWPNFPGATNFLLLALTRYILKRQLKGVNSLEDFQRRMQPYLGRVIATTMNTFTVSGTENLRANTNYTFISNHRDITLDAALVNHILLCQFNKTPRIAVGDNLLKTDFIRDLLRLNKCFMVSRQLMPLRKKLACLRHLSAYIYSSLNEDGHCVWLAQKGGRAKDGLDKTDPAIIKMLAMHKKPYEAFSDYIKALNIIPVSISYEYDPCDLVKAKELYMLAATGKYTKSEQEDFKSIGQGILGYKGNVHLNIGSVITADLPNANAAAQYLDQQIISNYKLHPSNFFAYQRLYGELPSAIAYEAASYSSMHKKEQAFERRFNTVPEYLHKYWLTIYANPVVSKLQL